MNFFLESQFKASAEEKNLKYWSARWIRSRLKAFGLSDTLLDFLFDLLRIYRKFSCIHHENKNPHSYISLIFSHPDVSCVAQRIERTKVNPIRNGHRIIYRGLLNSAGERAEIKILRLRKNETKTWNKIESKASGRGFRLCVERRKRKGMSSRSRNIF